MALLSAVPALLLFGACLLLATQGTTWKPELIFTARDRDGVLVGYLFGIPSYGSGPSPDTVILKTYASLHPGLGRHLAHALHTRAQEMGFDKVIHALIHDDNRSAERCRRHGGRFFAAMR